MKGLYPAILILLMMVLLLIVITLLIVLVIINIFRNRVEKNVFLLDDDQKSFYEKWSTLDEEEQILISKIIDNMK